MFSLGFSHKEPNVVPKKPPSIMSSSSSAGHSLNRNRRQRSAKPYKKNAKQPLYSSKPITSTTAAATLQTSSPSPPSYDHEKVQQQKATTPMGRAAVRFPASRPLKSTTTMDANIEGEGISGVQALTNGTQMVDLYLRSLWSGEQSVVPSSTNARNGLITLTEHQRILAIVLRDYTNRLSVAYRTTMNRSSSIAEYRNRELQARLVATLGAFRQCKQEVHQKQNYIKQLEFKLAEVVHISNERNEKYIPTVPDEQLPTGSRTSTSLSLSSSSSSSSHSVDTKVPSRSFSTSRNGKNTTPTASASGTVLRDLDGAATRWTTPEPNFNEAQDLVKIAQEEKDHDREIGATSNDDIKAEDKVTKKTEISKVAQELDTIAENAKSASAQVREDMREERKHAVQMRASAIASVKHSISELELSMSGSGPIDEKKEKQLSSLNSSLSELEVSGFQKSRRGSFAFQ